MNKDKGLIQAFKEAERIGFDEALENSRKYSKFNEILKKLEDVEYKIDLLTAEYDRLNRDIYLDSKAVGSVWDDIEYRSDY